LLRAILHEDGPLPTPNTFRNKAGNASPFDPLGDDPREAKLGAIPPIL
jgi:hypothetical protein